ncbi:protein SRC2 homolog [Elaeis guineensis]|uniref:Protein SRC2 n=1 Tax=Elaeis guineensis var. tenera TaxID=51953 RepID=A0A6I9SAS1_ELAGV|nr:protein SRC2 [Elaeis guineensis]
MASRYEVEVTIGSARDLKNVNWRHGDLQPYAVVWIDPASKCSTKVAVDGDVNPEWDEKVVLSLPPGQTLDDAVLFIDIVHAGAAEDVKPLVGSARLPLREVIDDAGIGGKASRALKLKRPSGRPHGKLDVRVAIKEPSRYYDPYAPPYGQRSVSRDYQYGYGQPYAAAPPPAGYPYSTPAPPPAGTGYPYGAPAPAYGAPPVYASGSYGAAGSYGAPPVAPVEEKKKSKFGMGTGLAVGAAAGVLGGLALAEGIDYVEDKIADDAAEKVEDDLGYDDGGYDGDDF